jgi:hypothetical protein
MPDDDPYQEEEQDADSKLRSAMFIGRYRPEAGRADRMASNIPGGHTSDWGSNGDHFIGHGGSN